MKKLFLVTSAVFFIAGCVRNPVTGRRELTLVTESQELAMGADADRDARAEYGEVPVRPLQDYMQTIGRKLSSVSHRPNLDWRFLVVDSPVVNAFAIPGGYVYVTRGLLAYVNSEAELAGVVGHEVGHITARHTVRQLTRAQLAQIGLGVGSVVSPAFGQFQDLAGGGLGLVFLKFGRDAEREADRLGVEYAARNSWDPREVSKFFEVLARLSAANDRETIPGWMSTHPDPGDRAVTTRQLGDEWISRLKLTPEVMTIDHDGFVKRLDGLVYGENPREGFVEEGRFYHPDLEFQVDLPAGASVENTKRAVLITSPQASAQIQLTIAPGETSIDGYLNKLAANGTRADSGSLTTIHGNRAYEGTFRVNTQSGPMPVLVTLIEYRNAVFQMVAVAANLNASGAALVRTTRSFRQLTDRRVLQVQPDRLKIHPTAAGDTLTQLASRFGNPRVNADDLAVLNRIAIDQSLAAGRLVKVVERGR